MTSPDRSPLWRLELALPDSWVLIPLHDERLLHNTVARMIRRQFAGLDDQPLLRADTERALLGAAEDARNAGGVLLAISLLRAGPLPIPASLVIHLVVPEILPDTAKPGILLDSVAAALTEDHGSGDTAVDMARIPAGPVLRRIRDTDGERATIADTTPTVRADYWLEDPDGRSITLLTFSTPLVTHRNAMLDLFDAVVATTSWEMPPAGAALTPAAVPAGHRGKDCS